MLFAARRRERGHRWLGECTLAASFPSLALSTFPNGSVPPPADPFATSPPRIPRSRSLSATLGEEMARAGEGGVEGVWGEDGGGGGNVSVVGARGRGDGEGGRGGDEGEGREGMGGAEEVGVGEVVAAAEGKVDKGPLFPWLPHSSPFLPSPFPPPFPASGV